ncbi:MAG: ELWxxDGT repeat protein [Flavobacteriales bacterium]
MSHRYLPLLFLVAALQPVTAQIPTLLLDINPTGGSNVSGVTCVNGLLYFSADDGIHGSEVWVSDGTSAGTYLLKDINPGADGSTPYYFMYWQGRAFFSAENGVDGFQLWSSDGTEVGTQVELDINNINGLSASYNYTVYNDMLVFQGWTSGAHIDLWITDGTEAGTVMVKGFTAGSGQPMGFKEYNGLLYFSALTPSQGRELWVTDGTEAGTMLVKDIYWSTSYGTPRDLTVANGLLFFRATNGFWNGAELWATDGTEAGTYMVKDIVPGADGSNPGDLVSFNGEVWFRAYDGSQAKLWHSDGTEEGTQVFPDPTPSFDMPYNMATHNGELYFLATNTEGKQLWKTDGTTDGTSQISYPGSTVIDALDLYTSTITSCGDHVFYPATYDAEVGAEFYTLLAPVGIAEQAAKDQPRLYPSPATDRLFMSDAPARATLQLYASNGALALQADVQNMDISALPTGLYLARIMAQDGTLLHVQRVVLN